MRLSVIIEEKEDTAKKLAEAQGKPTKHYIFAPEINRLTRIVRSIYKMLNVDIGTVNPSLLKDLGDITDGDYLNILNTLEAVNYLSPSFVKFTNGEVNYVYSFIGEEGVYGEGAGQFTQEGFVLLEETSDETPIELAITALTGDVTASGTGSVQTTIADGAVSTNKIANNAVTNSKLAQMVANTIKLRGTGNGEAQDLEVPTNRLVGRGTSSLGLISVAYGLYMNGNTLMFDHSKVLDGLDDEESIFSGHPFSTFIFTDLQAPGQSIAILPGIREGQIIKILVAGVSKNFTGNFTDVDLNQITEKLVGSGKYMELIWNINSISWQILFSN